LLKASLRPLPIFSTESRKYFSCPLQGTAEPLEFLVADIVVIGAPMYNFTIASQLKAWLDRIIIGGKTFLT